MAAIVGTASNIANGGSYTAGAGSNRVVVFIALSRQATFAFTTLSWNSITRSATVNGGDVADRDDVAIYVFKESELPAGAANATVSFTGTADALRLFAYTVSGVDQTTPVRVSNTGTTALSTPVTVALAAITVGDICIGGVASRDDPGGLTFANSFTEDLDISNTGGGRFGSGNKTAVSTTETLNVSYNATPSDGFAAAIALAPVSSTSIAAISSNYHLAGIR